MAIYQGGKILSGGGPSPFSIAEKAGFEGTEAEFNELLANIDEAATKEELENAINNISAPDVSGQISEHNIDENAHNDIRQAIENAKESVKNELLNGAGVAYDTLKELGELIDENHDAIDALEIVATSKADKEDLTNHINDKNNPHGVTAEDVGARPDTWMPTPADIGAATVAEVNQLKTSVSEGKALVAAAVTDKGVSTAADATFATIASNVGSITTLSSGTSDATATAAQILSGKTAYVNGSKVTGSMPDNTSKTSNGTVPGINSSYPNVPTREGDNLQYCVDTDGKARISMVPPAGYYQGGGGSYINRPASDFGNAAPGDVLSGKTFTSSSGLTVTGTIASQAAQTITPGTSNKTIAAGQYLSGEQTIKGDANLIAANILSGVNIFGVAGSATASSMISTGTVTASNYKEINIPAIANKSNFIVILVSDGIYSYVQSSNYYTSVYIAVMKINGTLYNLKVQPRPSSPQLQSHYSTSGISVSDAGLIEVTSTSYGAPYFFQKGTYRYWAW